MNDQLDGSNREGPLTLSAMTQEWMDSIQNMDTEELLEKAMNACLLLVAFGFSFYTMVTIDHEFTRGWTQQEIAMRIPLDNWASYESALAEKPIITKTFINVVIYSLGDWLSQTVFQKKNVLEFDVSRTLRNGFIGLCFGPLVHMYYEWSDTILPVEGGLMNRVQKVFMDQTLYLTIKCSMYIAAVGILQGDDLKTVKETIQDRIGPICFTAWKFWPLIHCVTYGVSHSWSASHVVGQLRRFGMERYFGIHDAQGRTIGDGRCCGCCFCGCCCYGNDSSNYRRTSCGWRGISHGADFRLVQCDTARVDVKKRSCTCVFVHYLLSTTLYSTRRLLGHHQIHVNYLINIIFLID
jgi:protein Mpv17